MMPPPASRPVPTSSGGGWVLAVVLLVVVALVAAGAAFAVRSASDDDDTAARRTAAAPTATTTAAPTTTTTTPRVTQPALLSAYCDAPGAKWPEVPPHVPGEPDRTQVRFLGGGVANAAPQNVMPRQMGDGSTYGGSTVISPQTDGVFTTNNASVLPRTRTVACVRFIATDPMFVTCAYGRGTSMGRILDEQTIQLGQNRYEITVYELHSGGILHKGEILARGGTACPEYAWPSLGAGWLAYGLEDQDILDWFTSHFVGGKPA